jgi:hypothetical protein
VLCLLLVDNFNALFLYSRVVAGHVVVRAGQPPWPVSAALNANPSALTVRVQLRLTVLCVVLFVDPSTLFWSAERRSLAVLLCALASARTTVIVPEFRSNIACRSGTIAIDVLL